MKAVSYAHFAGSGPEGMSCGDCVWCQPERYVGRMASRGDPVCLKAKAMAPGAGQLPISPYRAACKYFREKPPCAS